MVYTPPTRRQPADGLQLDRPLCGGGAAGTWRPRSRAARVSPPTLDGHDRPVVHRARSPSDLLVRRRLVQRRRRRRPTTHPGVLPAVADAPNDLWTADFKGQFRTGDQVYCYPLTMADLATRFLLTCHGLRSTKCELAKPVFERAFREYGLPRAIRTDNGVPFATAAIHGLSFLNVYCMQLGIVHQRIRRSSPQRTAPMNACTRHWDRRRRPRTAGRHRDRTPRVCPCRHIRVTIW